MTSQNAQAEIERYKKRILDLEQQLGASKQWYKFHKSISYELRTYMSAIIGFSMLLQSKTELDETQSSYVDKILNNGAYPLLERMNNYVDFNKLVIGEITPQISSINLYSKLDEFVIKVLPKAAEKGIQISYSVDTKVPVSVICDGTRVFQIIDELIKNAIRFTSKGSVTLSVNSTQIETESFLNIKVEDTGSGISPEDVEKLRGTLKNKISALDMHSWSLGLMIVKLLCDLLNGNIEVESQVGIGSVFQVDIPYEISPSSIT